MDTRLDLTGVVADRSSQRRIIGDRFRQVTKGEKKMAEVLEKEAQLCIEEGDHERAIAKLNEAVKVNPSSAQLFLLRGNSYRMLQMLKNAVLDATIALEINPKFIKVYNLRGLARAQLGEWKKSFQDLYHAFQRLPFDDQIYPIINQVIGNVYKMEGPKGVQLEHLWNHVKEIKSWRTHKFRVLNCVRDQGRCDCCWAISICQCVEALRRIQCKDEELVQLSIQDLIDCTLNPSQDGSCYKLSIKKGLQQMVKVGVRLEKNNPFKRRKCRCGLNEPNSEDRVRISSFRKLDINDEETLVNHLNFTGPFIVGLRAYNDFLFPTDPQHIYMGSEICQRRGLQGHAMTIVGAGQCTKTGINYWEFINSYGPKYGEQGFGRLARLSSLKKGYETIIFAYTPDIDSFEGAQSRDNPLLSGDGDDEGGPQICSLGDCKRFQTEKVAKEGKEPAHKKLKVEEADDHKKNEKLKVEEAGDHEEEEDSSDDDFVCGESKEVEVDNFKTEGFLIWPHMLSSAIFAVEQHNERRKDSLEFQKIMKFKISGMYFLTYLLTLLLKDSSGQSKIYKSVIYSGGWARGDPVVQYFGEKSDDEKQDPFLASYPAPQIFHNLESEESD